MATSSSSNTATPAPADTRNYLDPGIFVGTWPNIFIVEELGNGALGHGVVNAVPWDVLCSIKMASPEVAQGIVISGWDGVREVLTRLERVMLRVR